MARGYPPEFRHKVLDLIAAGGPVAEVAQALAVSGQTIYNWRKQDLIDRGEAPGLTSIERAELVAARRRIRELEAELAATKRARELLREAVRPKTGSRPSPRWLRRVTGSRSPAASSRSPSPASSPGGGGGRHPVRSATPG